MLGTAGDYQNNNDLSLDATMDIISPIKKPRGEGFMNYNSTVEQFAVTDSMIENRTKNVNSPRYKQLKLPKVTLKNGDMNIIRLSDRISTERPSVVEGVPRKTFGDLGKFSLISNDITSKQKIMNLQAMMPTL